MGMSLPPSPNDIVSPMSKPKCLAMTSMPSCLVLPAAVTSVKAGCQRFISQCFSRGAISLSSSSLMKGVSWNTGPSLMASSMGVAGMGFVTFRYSWNIIFTRSSGRQAYIRCSPTTMHGMLRSAQKSVMARTSSVGMAPLCSTSSPTKQ